MVDGTQENQTNVSAIFAAGCCRPTSAMGRPRTQRRNDLRVAKLCAPSAGATVSLCIIARREHGKPINQMGSPPRRAEIGGRPPPLPSEPDAGHAAVGIACRTWRDGASTPAARAVSFFVRHVYD